jgi:hypothetical protein
MALSPTVFASQFDAGAVLDSAADMQTSQFDLMTVFNIPSEETQVSQFDFVVADERQGPDAAMEVSQLDYVAVLRGRIDNPKVRAWTFTLDGHDYYVLQLGNDSTIVYDTFAEQWYDWGSGDAFIWRAGTGGNWLGGRTFAEVYGSNILVGDNTNGSLYFLDPEGFADEDPVSGAEYLRPFIREITGQVPAKGYDMRSCYGVSLMGSIGEISAATLTAITLFTSDDEGHTYDEHETIDVSLDDYSARVDWNSGLGSFEAPGRLFKVRDYGALQRIDWLDMATDED